MYGEIIAAILSAVPDLLLNRGQNVEFLILNLVVQKVLLICYKSVSCMQMWYFCHKLLFRAFLSHANNLQGAQMCVFWFVKKGENKIY